MKKRNYAKYLIVKEYLPLFIVFTLITTITFFSSLMASDFYCPSSDNGSMLALTAPMMVFAAALPLFVYNYKYSLKRGDTYYQLPLEQKEIKNTRIIAGLCILVTSFILSSLITSFAQIVRYILAPDSIIIAHITYFKYFHAGYLFAAIGVSLVTVVIEYFISCFCCSLASKPISALLINVSLQLILILTLNASMQFARMMCEIAQVNEHTTYIIGDLSNVAINYSPGVVIGFQLPGYIATEYAFDVFNHSFPFATDNRYLAFLIICIVLEVLVGALACFFTLYMKDGSGESCNNYGFANKKLNSLFFLSIIPVLMFFLSLDQLFGFPDVIGVVIVAASYYLLFALFIGSFKMPKFNYAIIGGMSALFIFAKIALSLAIVAVRN